jgi:hypothetical protein
MRVASANGDEETNGTIGTEFGGNQIRTSRRRGLLATKVETTLRSGNYVVSCLVPIVDPDELTIRLESVLSRSVDSRGGTLGLLLVIIREEF